MKLERERVHITEIAYWSYKDLLINQIAWYFMDDLPKTIKKIIFGFLYIFKLCLLPITVFISAPIISYVHMKRYKVLEEEFKNGNYDDLYVTDYRLRWK